MSTRRIILFLLMILLLVGCDQNQLESFFFKESLKRTLIEQCGEEDKICIEAVKKQIDKCIEKADGKRFLKDPDDEKEAERFTKIFYSCLVNRKGEPVFEV